MDGGRGEKRILLFALSRYQRQLNRLLKEAGRSSRSSGEEEEDDDDEEEAAAARVKAARKQGGARKRTKKKKGSGQLISSKSGKPGTGEL